MSELPKIAVVVSVASFLAVSPSALHAQSECNARQILQPGNCIGDDLDALEIELAKQINDYTTLATPCRQAWLPLQEYLVSLKHGPAKIGTGSLERCLYLRTCPIPSSALC